MNAARIRELADPSSGKTWRSECAGDCAVFGAAPGAKGRRSEKRFADAGQARAQAEKEELKRLRQGWRLRRPDAAPGEPALLCALGRGYTGAMAVAALDGGAGPTVFNSFDDAAQRDELIALHASGEIAWRAPLEGLCWELIATPAHGLLVRLDHGVWAGAPGPAGLRERVAQNPHPASFLSAGGGRAAWYAEPHLEVVELASDAGVLREAAEPAIYGGHSPQMAGALSPDGRELVYCTQPGRLQRVRPGSGEAPSAHAIDAEMIDAMRYSADGRWLFLRERYGRWRWHCLDAGTLHPRPDAPLWSSQRSDLAIAPDGRIALSQGAQIAIYDPHTLHCTLQFRADHVARGLALAWSSSQLAVRTDLGCAGLYATDRTTLHA